jgi:hypothetical protein
MRPGVLNNNVGSGNIAQECFEIALIGLSCQSLIQ